MLRMTVACAGMTIAPLGMAVACCCHPEQSEGSYPDVSTIPKILRCAQNDSSLRSERQRPALERQRPALE
ncbi:MAG: hypothetical protein ACOX0F_05505 [Syntrophomonadaceae bacterium]